MKTSNFLKKNFFIYLFQPIKLDIREPETFLHGNETVTWIVELVSTLIQLISMEIITIFCNAQLTDDRKFVAAIFIMKVEAVVWVQSNTRITIILWLFCTTSILWNKCIVLVSATIASYCDMLSIFLKLLLIANLSSNYWYIPIIWRKSIICRNRKGNNWLRKGLSLVQS